MDLSHHSTTIPRKFPQDFVFLTQMPFLEIKSPTGTWNWEKMTGRYFKNTICASACQMPAGNSRMWEKGAKFCPIFQKKFQFSWWLDWEVKDWKRKGVLKARQNPKSELGGFRAGFNLWLCMPRFIYDKSEGLSIFQVGCWGFLQELPDLQLVGICTVQRSSEDSSVEVPMKSKFRQLWVSLRSCISSPCWLSSFRFRFFPEACGKRGIKTGKREKRNPGGS